MSTYYITHIRTEHPYGASHPHIGEGSSSATEPRETRAQVISYILNHGLTYMTLPPTMLRQLV